MRKRENGGTAASTSARTIDLSRRIRRQMHNFHPRSVDGRENRRQFMKAAAAIASVATLGPTVAWARDAAKADALIQGKDPRLIVHTTEPLVLETPCELLAGEGTTPMPLVFVRNVQPHDGTATLAPGEAAGWKLEIGGLVDKAHTIDVEALAKLEQVEHEMVLQCSGNSRSLFSVSAPVKGTPWGRGGMADVSFAGVRLATLINHLGVKVSPDARYLSAEGRDKPAAGEQDFEHSIPLDDALRKSFVALRMNGRPLPAVHGGPLRLVTPGYYGTMQVKWLSRLRFDSHESNHTSQIPHYRTPREPIAPGAAFTPTFANSEPNWRMKIKSVVLSPSPKASVSTDGVEVRGVAFNDGESPIERVLVSGDRGASWQPAELHVPKSPYAWYRWHTRLKLAGGEQQIWALAIDRAGRTQPSDGSVAWNPQGYTWNGMEKIEVTVS